ncbi:MAG TPA: glycosyltransferase family 2 protein [Longimicrobiaceae bacterium]|jgi:glycosyltransferase involved in cell wall biosynthesis
MSIPVSVIVPNYDSGTFLYDCIRSINDGIPPEEIIIVDDVSTDGSLQVAYEMSRTYANVRVMVRDRNGGAAEARRVGIHAAKCEWIACVDADDYLDSGAVEAAYETAVRTGADVCIWQMWRSTPEGESRHLALDGLSFPMTGREAVLLTLGTWRIHPLGVSRKRNYVAAYDGFEETSWNADELITRLVLANADRISLCDKRYYYRIHPSSSSQALRPRRLSELDSHLWLIRFCHEHSVPQAIVERIVLNAIGFAWFLMRNRQGIGIQATHRAVRSFVAELQRAQPVWPWILRRPKHLFALLAISVLVRVQ